MIVAVLIGPCCCRTERRPRHGWRRGLHVEPQHRQSVEPDHRCSGGRLRTSLFLAWIAGGDRKPASILGNAPTSQSQPAGGAVPITPPTSGGVLDSLKKVDEQQGQPAPSGPQAPRSQ
jgi:hypothetical protein